MNPLEEPLWDKLVMSHPDGSFFHGTAWAKVLSNTYGHAPHYFGMTKGERLLALVPMMEVRTPLAKRCGVALPFTDECKVLECDSMPPDHLLEQGVDFGRERKWRYVEFRGGDWFQKPNSPSLSFFGHTLGLCDHEERLFRSFGSSVRRAIRKAQRASVQVEISESLESVRTFYSLHCKTRKMRHGLPPQPYSFFHKPVKPVVSKLMGVVALARSDRKPSAAALFCHLGNKAIL